MLCCIGDLHIDKLSHRVPNFNNILILTLRATIKAARLKGCSNFMLLGDVFDTSIPSDEGMVLLLRALADFKDCNFYLLLGNHDYSKKETHSLVIPKVIAKLYSQSNFEVIDKPKYFNFEGTKVYASPHPYVKPADKKVHFNIGHFAVNGAKSDNGFAIRTKNSPKGKWILGDFHTPQNIKGAGYYTYVGSLTQLSFSEKANKRVVIVDKRDVSSISVDLLYKLGDIHIKNEEDFDKKIDNNESTFYRAIVNSGLNIPPTFLKNNPSIIKLQPKQLKKDKKAAVILKNIVESNPLANLPNYLGNKKLEDSVIDRAVEIANSIKLR